MAKFRLQEGEQVIERTRVRDAAGDKQDDYELILTDRRIAVTRTRRSAFAHMFGVIGALVGEAFRDSRLEYQISRERFGSAEATADKELSVRSTGEGYALIHFDLKLKDAATWAARLQRWATGEAIEIATATVVKR